MARPERAVGAGYRLYRPLSAAVAGAGDPLRRGDAGTDGRHAMAGSRAESLLYCRGRRPAVPRPHVRPGAVGARSGSCRKRPPDAAGNVARAERRWAPAGGGAQSQRYVGVLGKHAVRPRPALLVRPDRPFAGVVILSGGTAGHGALL